MTFDDYQKKTRKSIINKKLVVSDLVYSTIAIGGETGEILDKVKKLLRDKDGKIDDQFRLELAKEMGDALWYLSRMADVLEMPLSKVAKMNLDKVLSRFKRGKIHGSGDNR